MNIPCFRTTNCYGLSYDYQALETRKKTFPYNELLWFILEYAGYDVKYAGFPYNELLWFIPRKIKVCIFSIA